MIGFKFLTPRSILAGTLVSIGPMMLSYVHAMVNCSYVCEMVTYNQRRYGVEFKMVALFITSMVNWIFRSTKSGSRPIEGGN
jgi:hypothetical protein